MLAGVAICGAPWLVHRNAGEVRIGPLTRDQTSHVQPDQSLYLMQMYADGRKVHVQDAPRIIIETSASESRCHIINKVFKYLYETERASSRPFKAEIAVWVREEFGLSTSNYPCDECYGGDKHNTYQANGLVLAASEGSVTTGEIDENSGSNPRSQGSNGEDSDSDTDSSQSYEPSFNPLARTYYRRAPENPQHKQWIYRRSPTWIPVYDESLPAGQGLQSELILDVYDILRPCSQFPDYRITDRTISIPLGTLRDELELEVQRIRNPPAPPVWVGSPATNSPQPRPLSPDEQSDTNSPAKQRRVV
ncbi:hypothetical protein ACGC1H_006371 [Rhizoctonia solani]